MVASINNQPTPDQIQAQIKSLYADMQNPATSQAQVRSDECQIQLLLAELPNDNTGDIGKKLQDISNQLKEIEAKIKSDPQNAAEYNAEIQSLQTQAAAITGNMPSSLNPSMIHSLDQKC